MKGEKQLQIKLIRIKNYIGVNELELEPGKINIIKGPKGIGKSTILEGIEKLFTNKDRRIETIKHGETEATLFLETDEGLEIDRRIRSDKASYFKLRKGEEGISSTEKYLKDFINGDIFRPVDWVNSSVQEQTKSILNMLQIEWSKDNIVNWFGELTSDIDFNQHILMVLKAIELKYYKDREEVNRRIRELKTQIQVIKKDMPVDYDGEIWRDKKVQEYYNKVSEAQKINGYIKEAKSLKENIKSQVDTIEANAESEKSRTQMKYKDQRQDIKDIVDLSKSKIEKSKSALTGFDVKQENNISRSYASYQQSLNELEKEFDKKRKDLKIELEARDEQIKLVISESKETEKDTIQLQETKIATKQQELISLDEIESQAIKAVETKKAVEIEKANLRLGKAIEYLKVAETTDTEPLQVEADEVASMQSYLRQWDNMIDIRDNKLSNKEIEAGVLTARVDKARTLPSELLKTAKMPVEGISVDEKGMIRINDTLIDGLSDGEKLTLAMKIAKAQCGELKILCIDKYECLDGESQKILEKEMSEDQYQYFITIVSNTENNKITIEKRG